ncbi:DUF2325 domain-containing protein (plasmid) [Bacillus velezensis]|uniref:DUF2325 domain-containing protein n=1 Tax=Bacillus velezensis TaxID=492670 RepID=UPI000987DD61|nr:DUF2325 domain-containing protein [Bacillus velezensis]AQS42444.1 hypothetical protein BVH55_00160 [Bacillus velezensis]WNR83244.1 DUF2325 domain-containing protein [Bacillus velezensis]
MNKENILNECVYDMVDLINKLNLININETKAELKKYFLFLESLSSLRDTDDIHLQSKHNSSYENNAPNEKVQVECYKMKRNLKGGWIEEQGIYVPERIVREYGLEEGDLISAVHIADKHYKYELIEKSKNKQPVNRVELNYCILSKENSYLVASEYWKNGEKRIIKYDDIPHTFLINNETIQKYDLTEGSIVDIAYKKSNVNEFKVIWKHDMNSIPYAKPLPSSFYKEKVDKEEPLQTNELKGKKILLLGGQRTADFERAIANIGGELTHADDSINLRRLESMVKNCDYLVIMIYNVGHVRAEKAKDLAKKYNKPFDVMDSRGISNLVETTKSVVNS